METLTTFRPNIDLATVRTAQDFKTAVMLFGFQTTNPNSTRIRLTDINGNQHNVSNRPEGLVIAETGEVFNDYKELAMGLIEKVIPANLIATPVIENGKVTAIEVIASDEYTYQNSSARYEQVSVGSGIVMADAYSSQVVGHYKSSGTYQVIDLRQLALENERI